jgi:hypothetical protein
MSKIARRKLMSAKFQEPISEERQRHEGLSPITLRPGDDFVELLAAGVDECAAINELISQFERIPKSSGITFHVESTGISETILIMTYPNERTTRIVIPHFEAAVALTIISWVINHHNRPKAPGLEANGYLFYLAELRLERSQLKMELSVLNKGARRQMWLSDCEVYDRSGLKRSVRLPKSIKAYHKLVATSGTARWTISATGVDPKRDSLVTLTFNSAEIDGQDYASIPDVFSALVEKARGLLVGSGPGKITVGIDLHTRELDRYSDG